jgi:hypothetical protein
MGSDISYGLCELKVQQHEIKFVSQCGVVIICNDDIHKIHKYTFEKDIKNECYDILTNLKKDDVIFFGIHFNNIFYIKHNDTFLKSNRVKTTPESYYFKD